MLPITKNAQFPDRGRTAWQLNVYAGERRDFVGKLGLTAAIAVAVNSE
jgi:hypothetical protein